MDFHNFDTQELADSGVWVTINHPVTGEPTDVRFKLASANSKRVMRKKAEQDKQRTKRRNTTTEQLSNDGYELAAHAILDWENVEYQGEQLECNQKNKLMILKSNSRIFSQVIDAIGDEERFFPSSSTSSESGSDGTSSSTRPTKTESQSGNAKTTS